MIGQTLNNRYKITARIGRGAMGTVYRATDTVFNREVAVKVISGDLAIDPDMLERFKREGEALSKLRHPNIVEFIDAFQHDEQYVIVMEYVPGGSLHEMITQGLVPLERASHIAIELCDALIRSHHLNIIHRDLKPENVLITDDGTPKLADFGVARLSEGTRMTRSGTQVGTPYYMAPEAWEGKTLDAQADIWSLGVIFFEILTGQVPFGGDTGAAVMNKVLTTPPPDLKKLRSDVPAGMAKIVTRMLTRDKSRRYQTMRQVAVDLESLRMSATPKPAPAPRVAAPNFSAFFNARIFLMIGIAIAGTLVAFNFSSIRAALFPPEFTEDTNPTAGPAAVSTEPTQISTSLIPDGLWSEVLDKGYILIANDPDFAPQSSLKTVGFRPGDSKCPADSLTSAEMQGFDVDVAVRISENLGVEPCFVSPPWDEIAAGNWNAGWDIHVGSMTITTSRQAVLDFSVPYYFNPAVVAVYEGVDVDTLDDLAGRTLCAQAGSTYESWLTHAPMELPASSIFFDAPEKVSSLVLDTDTLCAENVVELKGLKVLVGYVTSQWVVDAQIADGLPLRRLGSAVFSEDLAIAFDKNSSYPTSSLRKRVDEIITQMHEDGTLSTLSNQWHGADLTQDPRNTSASSDTDCASPDVFCVGLVTQVGTIDDRSFNQSAWEGVERAKQELGAQVDFIETASEGDSEANIAQFGDAGYDVIVTVGFAFGEATIAAASAYPEVDFIGVDQFQAETTEGVAGLNFPEDQGGFLVGALAAMMSETHKIGAVCGTDVVPPVWRFGEGYRAGAAYADNLTGTTTEVFVVYHSDVGFDLTFTDPEWGAETAQSMIDQSVDVVFGCGGETGNGAVIAAAQAGAYVIGVDVDQYFTLPEAAPRMLSSALKLITPGVFDAIQASKNGTFTSGNVIAGAGYAPFHDLEDEVPDDAKVILEKLQADLASGAIQTNVPATKP